MKKYVKIILCIIGIIVLIFIIDLICIFAINRPLFVIRTDKDDLNNIIYRGLFYDVYNCEKHSTPQIKSKRSKFSCTIDRTYIGEVKEIIDTTKDIKDFSCAEALEEFYEDDNYIYYFNCIKGKYMIVKYESGYEETVSNALKHGSITISNLDNFNIEYIKQEKEVIKKEDIIADNGLLFSISWTKSDCIPIQLNVYNGGKYELYTSYKACGFTESCNSMLIYTKKESGIYDYDVMKIINNSIIADNMTFTNDNRSEFEIYTGNGKKVYMLITNSNNKYLEEFLKQIDVNLKTCADPDYN